MLYVTWIVYVGGLNANNQRVDMRQKKDSIFLDTNLLTCSYISSDLPHQHTSPGQHRHLLGLAWYNVLSFAFLPYLRLSSRQDSISSHIFSLDVSGGSISMVLGPPVPSARSEGLFVFMYT